MKSDNTHNDDFMHALHDDIPQDFEDDLYQRLQTLETDEPADSDPDTPRTWWTLAVASLMAVLLGGILLVSSQTTPQTLSTPNLPLDHVNNQRISADNAALLRPFDKLGGEPAYNISLSPDGAQLAVVTNQAVYLHDASRLQAEPRRIETNNWLHDAHFLADGRLIGLQANEYETETPHIVSLDTQTGSLTSLLQLPPGHGAFSELIINDAGTLAVFAGCDQNGGQVTGAGGKLLCRAGNYTIAAFDLTTGNRLFTKDITEDTVSDIALAGNGEWLIYFPTVKDGARAHNLQSGEDIALHLPENGMRSQAGGYNHLYQVFTSADGEYIAFSGLSRRGDVRVWHFETLLNHSRSRTADDTPPEHLLGFGSYPFGEIIFHPVTNEMLYAEHEIKIVSRENMDTPARTVTLDTTIDAAHRVLFDPSGERFYVLTRMGLLQTWDWQSKQPVDTLTDYISADHKINAVSSADGQRTLIFEQGMFNGMVPRLYDISGEQVTERFLQSAPDAYYPSVSAAISPDGRFAAVLEIQDRLSNTEPVLVLHDLQTGEIYRIQQLPAMQWVMSGVKMTFDDENGLRILSYPGKIWHYTLDMLLDDSEPPERPMNMVYLDEKANWRTPIRGTLTTGITSGFAINEPYLVADTCLETPVANCTENVLFVWDIRNRTEADYGIIENRHLVRIDLPDTDLNRYAYGVPAISADGSTIAVESCTEEVLQKRDYGDNYVCTQSELLVWQMDDVQNGDMEPADRIPLNTTQSRLVFSPYTDENGNRLLAVGGVKNVDEDMFPIEASTSLYQITADADISYIQTLDNEYQPAFRTDGNVLYLQNPELNSYRAWGVPGLNQ